MRALEYILYLFNTPSDFGNNWPAYMRNVVLHGFLIGLIAVFFESLVPGWGFVIGGAAYAAWELAQWLFREALPEDCAEDWAFVQCGALAYLNQDLLVVAVFAGFLLSGILRRV